MSFKQLLRPGRLGSVAATLPQGEGILAMLAVLQRQTLFPNPSATNRQLRHHSREPATAATVATNFLSASARTS